MRQVHHFGAYVLETPSLLLRRGAEILNLPSRQMETLALIVEAHGKPVPREVFLERVWKGAYVEEANLTQTIFLLRRALGKQSDGGEYIETLPRRGYRLAAYSAPGEADEKQVEATGTLSLADEMAAIESDAQSAPDASADVGTTRGSAVDDRAETSAQHVALAESSSTAGLRKELVEEDANSAASDRDVTRKIPGKPFYRFRSGRIVLVIAALCIFAGILLVVARTHDPVFLRSKRLTNDGAYKEVLAPLLFDGTHLYFTEIINNANYLAEVSPLGGAVTRHPMPYPGATAAAVSGLHEGVLFDSTWESAANAPVMLGSLASGSLRRIGEVGAHASAWSPDGQSLALARGHTLVLVDAAGNELRTLAAMAGVPFWPSWSPDGQRIRFSVNAGGLDQSLWEVRVAGGAPHQLLIGSPHAHEVCCGAWSPDGRSFVYVVDGTHASSLWVRREHPIVPLLQKREVELADGPLDFWRSPLISPDGKHIYAVGEQARGELVRYDARTHTFAKTLDGLSADTVSFSRDGKWIAYSLFPEGTLWRSRTDGSEKLALTMPGQLARFPQWSPDGRSLVYSAATAGHPWTVYVVSRDGGQSRALYPDGSSQGAATWSPDGQHVAFGRTLAFGAAVGTGKGITVVDTVTGAATAVAGSGNLWMARWSPTGDYLAAATSDRGKLMLYDIKAMHWSELSGLGVNDIVWAPDGQTIYFDAHNGSRALVSAIDLRSRVVRPFADLTNMQRTGFFGWRLSISSTGDLIVLRQTGFVEVYRIDVDLH